MSQESEALGLENIFGSRRPVVDVELAAAADLDKAWADVTRVMDEMFEQLVPPPGYTGEAK